MPSIKRCPRCNETNPGHSFYCVRCQKSLVDVPIEDVPRSENISKDSTKNTNYAHILKTALIIGAIGFVAAVFLSFGGIFCNSFYGSIGAGIAAGIASGRRTKYLGDAFKYGALSGAIVGLLIFPGLMLGAILPSLIVGGIAMLGMTLELTTDLSRELFPVLINSGLRNGIIGLFVSLVSGAVAASANLLFGR